MGKATFRAQAMFKSFVSSKASSQKTEKFFWKELKKHAFGTTSAEMWRNYNQNAKSKGFILRCYSFFLGNPRLFLRFSMSIARVCEAVLRA